MQHSTQRKLVRLISYNILYLDLNVKDKGTYILYLNEHIVLHFYFQANNTKRFLSETMQKGIISYEVHIVYFVFKNKLYLLWFLQQSDDTFRDSCAKVFLHVPLFKL